ncbi:LamG-like jellyroll fold domain-containing protein [Secundilactobacillus paracollinoides]|uniref:LamG-like jellyroll fold domain-containing protein n=1 Tax=Secundilactobacillus paracollinoides TaxID=240427 RepID=UPI000AA6FB02|nr:LamG-like jellyroll fold domain-containing protein [Secundilactobacillus paracollinoides]
MKPRVLASVLLCSATLLSTTVPAVAAVTTATPAPTNQIPSKQLLPTPFSNISFESGQPVDNNGQFKTVTPTGAPKVTTDESIDGKVAAFNGKSAYQLPTTDAQYDKLKNGMSIEAFFKYDSKGSLSGEHDIFSNQQSGGLGLGLDGSKLTFYAHVGGSYKQPSTPLKTDKWLHAVGVIDKSAGKVNLYVNGKLVDSKDAKGDLKLAQGSNIKHFVLGGDSSNSGVESLMTGLVKSARLYDHVLSADEIKTLSDTAQAAVHHDKQVAQSFESRLVGAGNIVGGHTYSLNVHTRQMGKGDIDQLGYEVTYDPNQFSFVKADQTLGGKLTTVTETKPGQLHITSSASFSEAGFRDFGKTRLARIKLRAKTVQAGTTEQATVKFGSATASMDGTPVTGLKMQTDGQQTVTIHGMATLDYNGDGIIGAGDVALAPADKKTEVAKQAVIRPYKHVIVLTTDGGGNPWDPKGMYYTTGSDPKWTTDPAIMAKRKNTYTMDLFNKQFAMSTSAHSVLPAISAQNYLSMLHGLPWGTMDKEYQATNSTAGENYFADFDKPTAKYPSVFKVLQQANPTQSAAAFAEWTPILNGITEPDAAVNTQPSESLKSFDDVANYIGTDDFKNTALTYMQSDYMDHTGHSRGWYNDNYWNEYAKYDKLFKTVMDKLEATGHIHDTLVIANADHGGKGTNHGQDATETNTNIFMALGGETVDSGHRLEGGSNADVSSLILNALHVAQPNSMTGKVFDSSAFLDQTDLVKKNRNVENIKLTSTPNYAQVHLSAKDQQLKTADMRIDLAGRSVANVQTPTGTKIIRQTVENGIMALTLGFDQQPGADDVATIKFKSDAEQTKTVKVTDAMVGTDTGKEILVDLHNEQTTTDPQQPDTPDNTNDHLRGTEIYATRTIGFYKQASGRHPRVSRWYESKSQTKWPKFTIIKQVKNRNGVWYQVRDNNHGRTHNKIGYIKANSRALTTAYYTSAPHRVMVIAKKGLTSYRDTNQNRRGNHIRRFTSLRVARIVKANQQVLLQLSNGQYITADKHMTKALR